MIIGLSFIALYIGLKKGLVDACFNRHAVNDYYPVLEPFQELEKHEFDREMNRLFKPLEGLFLKAVEKK